MIRTAWITVAVFVILAAWLVGWTVVGSSLLYRNASMHAANHGEHFRFRFGTLEDRGNGNYTIARETTTIPMTFGDSSYGFEVIPPNNHSYKIHFVARFPYAPKVVSGDVFESNVPSTNMVSKESEMQGGYVQDLGFDRGDPTGNQSIDIFVDDKLVKTITFTVVEQPAAK